MRRRSTRSAPSTGCRRWARPSTASPRGCRCTSWAASASSTTAAATCRRGALRRQLHLVPAADARDDGVARRDPGRPPVGPRHREHAGLGRPVPARAAAEALAGEPVEVIVTSGQQRPAPEPRPAAGATSTSRAGSATASCCRAARRVVTAGGKATILAALEAGVPLVVVPDHVGQARQRPPRDPRPAPACGCPRRAVHARGAARRGRAGAARPALRARRAARWPRRLAAAPGPRTAARSCSRRWRRPARRPA